LLFALQHLLGLADFRRDGRAELVDEIEQAAPVDDAAGADRQAARLTDLFFQPVDEM
jgi:hypothetical protein